MSEIGSGRDKTLGLTYNTTRWHNPDLLPPFPSARHEVWEENHRKLPRLFPLVRLVVFILKIYSTTSTANGARSISTITFSSVNSR
jgi:hypothetical protein